MICSVIMKHKSILYVIIHQVQVVKTAVVCIDTIGRSVDFDCLSI